MIRSVPVVLAALAVLPSASTAGVYDNLLTNVPPDSNTLVLVNVQKAYSSPIARSEKWADDYYRKYKSGTGFVPPDGELLVVASQVNLSSMTRDHQIGLVKVSVLPTIRSLAAREGGTASELGGLTVVLSPRDVYYTTLPGAAVAAVYPADRQATARWIRHATQSKTVDVAPYLKAAAEAAGDNIVTIAVDLSDSQDPNLLRLGLAASPAVVRQKGVDVDRVARFIATVRGLTFTAKATDKIVGTVRVDFAEDPAPFRRILRELFLELFEEQGVAVPGMEQWETTYGARSMELSGTLDSANLRRVLSLFAFPGASSEDSPKVTPGEVSLAATQRYWGALNTVLADLRTTRDSKNYDKMATWHEKAANQLEQLSQLGVDPIAVQAAIDAARRFRAIGASLRGVPIDVNALSQKEYYKIQQQPFIPYWGGWWNWRAYALAPRQLETNIPQVRGEIARVIADDQKRRIETWSQIDQIMSDSRRRLNDKYKGGF